MAQRTLTAVHTSAGPFTGKVGIKTFIQLSTIRKHAILKDAMTTRKKLVTRFGDMHIEILLPNTGE